MRIWFYLPFYFTLFITGIILGIISYLPFGYNPLKPVEAIQAPLSFVNNSKTHESFISYSISSFGTYSNPYRSKNIISYSNGEIPVPILMYHHIGNVPENVSSGAWQYYVSVEEFERQMAYIYLAGYHVITLDTLLSGLEGKVQFPEKPVVLTFDDLPPDQIDNGLPILRKYGFKATFFLNVNRAYNDDRYVKAVLNDGHEIGSHSYNHIVLTKLKEDRLRFEIGESKRYLENRYGVKIKYFAYPGCSYNAKTEQIVIESGYSGAVSCAIPFNGKSFSERYHLGRRLATLEFDKFIGRLEDREGVW